MTATTHTDIGAGTVLRRAIAAEWARLWTVRSTWWALITAAGLMVFIGVAAGAGHSGEEPAAIWKASQFAIVPGQFAFLLVVLLAVTAEHSTGAIRSTLQWLPQRKVLLVARTLVPVAFVTACSVGLSAITALVAWTLLGDAAEVVATDIVASLGRIALVVAFGGLLTVGLGLLLRSTAGTLTAIFLLVLALPITLGNTGVDLLITISDSLPGRAIISVVVVDQIELSAGAIALVMAGWTAASLTAGAWSLIRRDTT